MDGKENSHFRLAAEAQKIGIALDAGQRALLERYCQLLVEWNTKLNLISRRDIGNLVPGHIKDSLSALPAVRGLLDGIAEPRVMDLGSGGGLPGLPIKICYPKLVLTCVEATNKKAKFLETAIRELGLKNAAVVGRHSRVLEKLPEHRGQYDLVLARAVAELRELAKLAFPFLKPGGWLLAFKAARAQQEATEARAVLKRMNGRIEQTITVERGVCGKERKILVVQKMS